MAKFPQLYLASSSPRRAELLTQIGVQFAVIDADCDETPLPAEAPRDYVQRMARLKANTGSAEMVAQQLPLRPILAADTAVICNARILGKPRDVHDAATMLRLLSGRRHQVLTAVALLIPTPTPQEWLALSKSDVTFRTLSEAEIAWYCRTGEPLDKAGSYGIQGYGGLFVTTLNGSYSGVMGLPLCETGRLLKQAGIALMLPTEN
ncbi:nucleoside triphosphate pyrophosphatase [Chromatium okenii]|uniref:Maf family protein n=1 Tax=Chromatium okenii TaxID=61644 RepID=UPI0034E96C1F